MSGNGSNHGQEIELTALLKKDEGKKKHNLSDEERARRSAQLTQQTKEQLSAAGKKGAAIANQRKREKRQAAARVIEDALREKAEEMLDRIIKPYFEALDLEPDPKWSPATKLNFFLEQTTASEKIASRLEGLPVARRREVDEQGHDKQRISQLPYKAVERALAGALSSGRVDLDALELDEVIEVEAEEVE